MRHAYNSGPCRFCGRRLSGAGFARASHEKADVRRGFAIQVHQWSWQGEIIPHTGMLVKNTDAAEAVAAKRDRFETFAKCQAYYNSQPIEAQS